MGGVGLEPTVSKTLILRVYLNLNDNIVSDIGHSKKLLISLTPHIKKDTYLIYIRESNPLHTE